MRVCLRQKGKRKQHLAALYLTAEATTLQLQPLLLFATPSAAKLESRFHVGTSALHIERNALFQTAEVRLEPAGAWAFGALASLASLALRRRDDLTQP